MKYEATKIRTFAQIIDHSIIYNYLSKVYLIRNEFKKFFFAIYGDNGNDPIEH